MTFWQWLDENKTQILGYLTGFTATLTAAIAAGLFEGLLDETTIKWLAIFGMFVGGGTVKAGRSNRTKERVAESKAVVAVAEATVAKSMETAINATPGDSGT